MNFLSELAKKVNANEKVIESINVIACSAVVIEFPNGVFITTLPLLVAASRSTLSTPIPALPLYGGRARRGWTIDDAPSVRNT